MNFRSINDLNKLIRAKLPYIPQVDAIIGIPRSGMIPASLIALYLGKPLYTVDQFYQGGYINFTERIKSNKPSIIKRVLVIDDSCNTGNCLRQVRDVLLKWSRSIEILYAAVYVTEQASKMVDFYFEICPLPRVFEWNIMDHIILSNSCVDMDGVLCIDPTREQNDDGEGYLEFIRTAKPLFIPQHKIKAIVTSRLEKYRKPTEQWLTDHNVKYDTLYMMDYKTAEERRKANKYGQYKAELYNATKATLFIESSKVQAEYIHDSTCKPVYCLEDGVFYNHYDKIQR